MQEKRSRFAVSDQKSRFFHQRERRFRETVEIEREGGYHGWLKRLPPSTSFAATILSERGEQSDESRVSKPLWWASKRLGPLHNVPHPTQAGTDQRKFLLKYYFVAPLVLKNEWYIIMYNSLRLDICHPGLILWLKNLDWISSQEDSLHSNKK